VKGTDTSVFHIVYVNTSNFVCPGTVADRYLAQGLRKVELTNEQKLEVFLLKGGHLAYPYVVLKDHKGHSDIGQGRGTKDSPQTMEEIKTSNPIGDCDLDDPEDLENCRKCEDTINRTSTMQEDSDYQHMCSMSLCSLKISSDNFPNEFFETSCNTSDDLCLYDEMKPSDANGKCFQVLQGVDVMVRSKTTCTIVEASTRESVIIQEWNVRKFAIRTGCQCAVKKSSTYS